MSEKSFVEINDLHVTFKSGSKSVRAVNGVSFSLEKGKTLALIGESGSGKSVTLRTLLKLHPDTASITGTVRVGETDVVALKGKALTNYRGKDVSMIFQEPLLALDPVYTVGDQIVEAIRCHEPELTKEEAKKRALSWFEEVKIPSPESRLDAYPHEMSGGMRQRAMIALALSTNPELILADEPTTALDATVQIQVLLLLRQLQRELGVSIIFVTHDMGAAAEVADRFAVMYAGQIVEEASAAEIMKNPMHPYTMALLATRSADALTRGKRIESITGAPPDLSQPITGCPFAPRCRFAAKECFEKTPEPVTVNGRRVLCSRVIEIHPEAQAA